MPADVLRRNEVAATLRWLENREKGFMAAFGRRTRGAVARRLDRLNAPVVYPWSPSMDGALPAHRLHRAAAALLQDRARGFSSRLWLALKAVAWPLLASAAAVPIVLRCWRDVAGRHGLTFGEQWRDVLAAAWKHGIFPTEYYHRRVYATAARADKSLYLNEREMIALLSAADRGADATRVDQRDRFHAACHEAGLSVPRAFAVFSRGAIDMKGGPGQPMLPGRDLFFRPETCEPGDRGEYWRWNAQARAWSCEGEALTAATLLKRFRETASTRPHVLQEWVQNHPEVARFTSGGLCTFKVATGVDLRGEPRVLFAALQMPGLDPTGNSPVAVDLTSGIDLETGRLLPAAGEFVSDGEFDNHPGTGALLTGAAVPHWAAVADYALRAHRHFHDLPFIGWQIAMSVGGPVLVDASTNWGFFPHVLPADTAFAELCLAHLRRVRCEGLGIHPLAPAPAAAGPGARPDRVVVDAAPGLRDEIPPA